MKLRGKTAILIGLLVVLLIGTSMQAFAYEAQLKPFRDVKEQDWAAESIYRLVAMGAVTGYENGTYQPDTALTREAFVKLLAQSVKPQAEKERTAAIKDVAKDRWSYGVIKQAYDAGWLDLLIKDGKFSPALAIKREEVAALTGFALLQGKSAEEKKQWLDTDWKAADKLANYADRTQIDSRLAPYVLRTYADLIMQGDDKGRFLPGKSLTRREAAATVDRLISFRSKGKQLDISAFYAPSGPYKKTERFADAGEIIFDWAKLSYEGAGKASLAFAPPSDWKQLLAAADAGGSEKTLMVFGNTTLNKLGEFVVDAEARKTFVNALADVLHDPQYGFDRVAIDLEGLVPASLKEPFTELIREVKSALSETTSLTVVVPPSYYYAGYDYKTLGELADTVVLMAYEFTHEESGLPSAPLTLVGDAVRNALAYIPADKLLLGISKQANQWTTAADGTVEFFRSPSIAAVESRISTEGTDSTMQLPYFLNRITFTDTRGTHLLWYENAESIQAKMRLAQDMGLQGVAIWQINQLTDADWSIISSFNVQ